MSEWGGGSYGGGATGLYCAVLEDAERALNESYTTLLENREFIEKLLTRKPLRSFKYGPSRPRMFIIYLALMNWAKACCWFTQDDFGAVTMRQVFDIVAVDPEVKRKQLASRFKLPWLPNELKETLEFYDARIRRKIDAHQRM